MENMNIQHTQHTKVTWVRMACALSSLISWTLLASGTLINGIDGLGLS